MRLPWVRARDDRDRGVEEEIRSHFAMAVADRIARGESPDAARAAARREFGNIGHVTEVTREMWPGLWRERLMQDVRYAVRSLRRSPVFAATAIATLALGMGLTTAMFTVVRGVLLRPLPFAAPNALYLVSHVPDGIAQMLGPAMADREYEDYARATRAFQSIASFRSYPATLLGAGEPARLAAASVTPSFFATLGIRPQYGRVFAATEDQPGADALALIGAALFRDRFGGDSSVIGRSVTIEGYRKTIIGVMPDGVDLPRGVQVWMPLEPTLDAHNSRLQVVIGRLAPGTTPARALAELRAFAQREEQLLPMTRREHTQTAVIPLRDLVVGRVRTPLLLFSIAVGFVLLIACANVANLMLMRGTTRRYELSIRAALGAARTRLVRQLLTESVVIAVAGGVLGFGLAWAGVRLLLLVLPPGLLPRAGDIHVDPIVVVAAAAACLAAGLVSGLLPAITASGRAPRATLADAGRTTTRAPFRLVFVTIEMGLSLVLLIGAGLMIRSFERLRSVDLGFAPGNLVTATLDFPETHYRTADAVRRAEIDIVQRVASLPGVRAAAAVNWLPLDSTSISGDFTLRHGRALPPDYMVLKPCVSANYFSAMGIRVRAGRGFLPTDDAAAERVVVISASMARTLWPTGDAVGQELSFADQPGPGDWMRIVGVVEDVVRNGPGDAPMPALYRPIAQVDQLFFVSHLTIVARADGDPSYATAGMRAAVHTVDPDQPVQSVTTMEARLGAVIAEPRFRSIMLVVFSAVALLMAAVGIYGVLAYDVAARTPELGIRLALGASPGQIVRRVLGTTVTSTVPGLLLGLLGALAATRLLSGFLFEIQPADPVTYVAASLVLLAAAICAAIGPGRRASRIDPVITMKQG
jgi:putative ABC transport system permease protein